MIQLVMVICDLVDGFIFVSDETIIGYGKILKNRVCLFFSFAFNLLRKVLTKYDEQMMFVIREF